MYDAIVFGATFLSAGFVQVSENCLVIERRPQAGYEFISALNFGGEYEKELESEEAKELQKDFKNRTSCFDISAPLYRLLEDKNILLNTEIISVEKKENFFTVTTHGVSGYRTFEAKKIIDTRCDDKICTSKTFNILMDGDVSDLKADTEYKKCGFENNYIIRIPVSNTASYSDARKKAKEIIEALPESHKLVLSADCFDYEIESGYPTTENDIMYFPSVKYADPLLAYDKGVCLGKELCNASF